MFNNRTPNQAFAHMGRLWRDYVRPHRWWLAFAAVLMMIEGSTVGLLSWMLKPMFDRVLVGGEASAIWWVGLAILSLFVVRAVTGVVSQIIMSRVALKTATTMQVDLLAHLTTLDMSYFQDNAPGALIERVQGDTAAVQRIWLSVIQAAGRDTVALGSLLVVALSIDWIWTLAALVGVPLLIGPMVVLQRYVRNKTKQTRNTSYERAKRLDEIFHGIGAVKLNGMERYQVSRFDTLVRRIVRAEVRSTAGRATMPGLIDVMTGVGFFAVLILGGAEIVDGTKTVGDFMSFFAAMILTFQPLRRLSTLAGSFQVAAISLDKIYSTFDLKPKVSGATKPPASGLPPRGSSLAGSPCPTATRRC